jgi:hypothetical protein
MQQGHRQENMSAIIQHERAVQKWTALMPKVRDLIYAGKSVQETANELKLAYSYLIEYVKEDPQLKARARQSWLEKMSSPEHRALLSRTGRERAQNRSPEARQQAAERTRKCWQDPAFRENHVRKIRQKWQDPEYRANMERKWNDPNWRAKLSSSLKGSTAFQASFATKDTSFRQDPAWRARVAENMKEEWKRRGFWTWIKSFDPEKRKRILQAIYAWKKKQHA